MLKLETEADLQRLIDEEIQESLTLDYKASAALAKNNSAVNELCKDVSAFANSAGGQIIYGIEEKDHAPIKIDAGTELPREWIEQVIDSNIQQRIEDLIIRPIPLGGSQHAYVVTIPQASARAPHQAPDKKYYKRQNFQSVPMEDYEIRDALRRATTPDLHVDLSFSTGRIFHVVFGYLRPASDPISIVLTVTNRSSQPAFHALIKIGIDTELPLIGANDFYPLGITGDRSQQYWLGKQYSSPPSLPIFRELDPDGGIRYPILVNVHSSLLERDHIFYLATSIQTPGFSAHEKWVIVQRGAVLELCPPGHSMNR
jgi:Putative DNA-binding domain